jgi:hypothetical protein
VIQLQQLIDNWVGIGQALVGSVGALAFVAAFLWTNATLIKPPPPVGVDAICKPYQGHLGAQGYEADTNGRSS